MKDWKKIIKGVAPTLATALGGPFAGMATKAIAEGLLGKSDGSDSDIYEALMNPENLHKLKKIEADFEVEMKKLDIDLERIAVDDRKSARVMATSTTLLPQVTLSAIFIGGFFALLWLLLMSNLDLNESIKGIAYTLLGVVGTNVTLAMKFWFGGSSTDQANFHNMHNSIPADKVGKR